MQTYAVNIREVEIGKAALPGRLRLPDRTSCLVVFAHGAGSSRLSPRNNRVAESLGRVGIATLLFDLLTEEEAAYRANVFDMKLLAGRMLEALAWVGHQQELAALPLGLFGASTGAAAALIAAAWEPDQVRAVVSRGGRPDLAGAELPKVKAPTLMIVGGADTGVIELNAEARRAMTCITDLILVPGATHLFEEPGALDQVIAHAKQWFMTHLVPLTDT